jgi:peptidoglycan/xylan/chitin deacetylase (PgdA/CDA1 family)
MGQVSRAIGSRLGAFVPLSTWQRLLGIELFLPRYHLVGEVEPAHTRGLYIFRTLRQFIADLDYFQRHFEPVGLRQVIEYLDGTGRLPSRCFLPTFDDGFREVSDIVAPLLKARGIPAVFFLNSSAIDNAALLDEQKKCLLISAIQNCANSAVLQKALLQFPSVQKTSEALQSCIKGIGHRERLLLDKMGDDLEVDFEAYLKSNEPYLTTNKVRTMVAAGFEFGAHSDDHPWYRDLSLEMQVENTSKSLRFFSDKNLCSCKSFAFPYSDKGVDSSFFEKLYSDLGVAVSFGSGGMKRHFQKRNLERFKMDYPKYTAAEIVGRELMLTLYQRNV